VSRPGSGRRAAGWLRPRQLWVRLRTELAKRFGLGHRVDELSTALAGKELYFSSPPLNADLIRAIKAITPQFSLREDEISRRVWELSQNGSSWAEYEALRPALDTLEEPARILEIGPGMGRSVVFLGKRLGWTSAVFDLYESDGAARKYPIDAPRSETSFCGDLEQLRRVLDHNGVDNYRLFDAADLDFRLDGLPGPYELIYSFYGVGFHWSLADFWEEIRSLMAPGGMAVFTVHHTFEEFEALGRMPHCYVPFRRILAKDRPLNLLFIAEDRRRLAPWMEVGTS
jgi:SAM-dependent methyltransferase